MHDTYRHIPCTDCPFRKDTPLVLRETTVKTLGDNFLCHKDTKKQCAGHMMLFKSYNKFVDTAKAFGVDLIYSGHHLVFKSILEFYKHHKYEPKRSCVERKSVSNSSDRP